MIDRILRASAVMGASSVVVAGASVVRYKVLALEAGPEGIGVLGVALAVSGLVSVSLTLGLPTSGVRALAGSSEDPVRIGADLRLLLLARNALVLLGGLAGFLLSGLPALTGGAELSGVLRAGVALGAAFTVGSAFEGAMVNGLGETRSLAAGNAAGALLGSAVTVAAALAGEPTLAVAAAAAGVPLFTTISLLLLRRDAQRRRSLRVARPRDVLRRGATTPMFGLGVAVAVGAIVTAAVQVATRSLVGSELGLPALGLFQAAWALAAMYLGFVLSALATEYYPRISRNAAASGVGSATVDLQVQVAVRLTTPVIALMLVAAPLLLEILYAESFRESSELLRLLLLGDLLKVPAWALVFVFAAQGRKWWCLGLELLWNAVFVTVLVAALPLLGLVAPGVAWLVAYAVYLVTAWVMLARDGLVVGRGRTGALVGASAATALVTWGLSSQGSSMTTILAAALAVAFASVSWASLVVQFRAAQRVTP